MKLNFREKGIPKWIRHRLLVLFLIFTGALVVFQILLNLGEEEKKVTMAEAYTSSCWCADLRSHHGGTAWLPYPDGRLLYA